MNWYEAVFLLFLAAGLWGIYRVFYRKAGGRLIASAAGSAPPQACVSSQASPCRIRAKKRTNLLDKPGKKDIMSLS